MAIRFLDALAEPSFERMPDGRLIFYAWFGRGYELSSERRYRTLRRDGRWMIGVVVFGYPLVTFFSVEHVGVYPVMAFVVLTGILFNLRVAWLLRGLPRVKERLTAAESRARTAAALSRRAIWGITIAFLAIATASVGIAVWENEAVFLVPAALYVGLAAWIGGGLFRLKRRAEQGSR